MVILKNFYCCLVKLFLRVSNIDINFILYFNMQKEKNWYIILLSVRKTINKNTYPHSNITNSTFITSKVIAYCYISMPINIKIQNAIDFLKKKIIKSFNKNIFLSNGISYIRKF